VLRRHLCISGELGSGKSSVAKVVARRTGADVVSMGSLQREMARARSLSTLETNHLAESDTSIDAAIDGRLKELADGPATVFDSRMAWHFVPGGLTVHLVVDPAVAARRLFAGRRTAVERHDSPASAWAATEERFTSERQRFVATYGVDIARLRNYDLVVDSSTAGVDAVAAVILAALDPFDDHDGDAPGPRLHLDPGRLAAGGSDEAGSDDGGPLAVAYVRPEFRVVGGAAIAAAARANGKPLVAARLAHEEIPDI